MGTTRDAIKLTARAIDRYREGTQYANHYRGEHKAMMAREELSRGNVEKAAKLSREASTLDAAYRGFATACRELNRLVAKKAART